jgi:hypothetical protein
MANRKITVKITGEGLYTLFKREPLSEVSGDIEICLVLADNVDLNIVQSRLDAAFLLKEERS